MNRDSELVTPGPTGFPLAGMAEEPEVEPEDGKEPPEGEVEVESPQGVVERSDTRTVRVDGDGREDPPPATNPDPPGEPVEKDPGNDLP